MNFREFFSVAVLTLLGAASALAQTNVPRFRVIAYYTGKSDKAHVSFVREANRWFARTAAEHGFFYASTNDWGT